MHNPRWYWRLCYGGVWLALFTSCGGDTKTVSAGNILAGSWIATQLKVSGPDLPPNGVEFVSQGASVQLEVANDGHYVLLYSNPVLHRSDETDVGMLSRIGDHTLFVDRSEDDFVGEFTVVGNTLTVTKDNLEVRYSGMDLTVTVQAVFAPR